MVHLGIFYLIAEFLSLKNNFLWLCSCMYRPNSHSLKQSFWDEIRTSNFIIPLPWVICRDFNTVYSLQDKMSDLPNVEDIHSANDLVDDLNLSEPPSFGKKFTWTNGQVDLT